jgi:hypothetical protein
MPSRCATWPTGTITSTSACSPTSPTRTNHLTTDAGDEVTGTGEYKVCAAKIEPVAERSEHAFPGNYASVVG